MNEQTTHMSKMEESLYQINEARMAYDDLWEPFERLIENKYRDYEKLLKEAFYELYPDSPGAYHSKKYESRYRWFFCSDIIEVIHRGDFIDIEITERGIRGNRDESLMIESYPPDFFTDEGIKASVEQWKEKELKHMMEQQHHKERSILAQIETLKKQLQGE